MSKKYKGKTCVYCGGLGISETCDHLLAREFVLERHRPNLPAVPACKACNNAKSKLEKYLTTVLPFGGRHADASENLSTMVAKRLRANPALRSQIERGLEPLWLPTPSGIFQRTSTVVIDAEQINTWVSHLTMGLIWHHWCVIVGGKVEVEPMLATGEGERYLARLFKAKVSRHVPTTSIGGDALIYEGVMGPRTPSAALPRPSSSRRWRLPGDWPEEGAGDRRRSPTHC
jgi:hypothetical protein